MSSLASTQLVRTGTSRRDQLRPVPGSEIITGLEYRELQTRPSITGWTPDLVECVAAQADSGLLMGLADLVDAMFADDRIDGVLQTLTLGTLGLPLAFRGGSEELRATLEGEDGVGGEWDSMHPEEELTQFYNWGVMLGTGVAQRVPLPRLYNEPQRYRLRCWHPRWLSYDQLGASGSHWRIQTRTGIKRVVPGGQFILFQPYGVSRPWNQGKWRRCAFPWLVKRFSLEDRANQGEVVGSPTWVGTSTQGGTERQRARFLAELRQLGRNGRIVLPDSWKLDLVEATGRTWEIFSESTDWADKAITIAIASQVTTTEGSPGFDSGKTQDQILASVTRYFAKQLSKCLYEQSVRPWAYDNTGSADDAPCGWWNTERSNSQASQATTFETLGRAIGQLDQSLKAGGVHVDSVTLAQQFSIPTLPNDPDETDSDTSGLTLAPTDLAGVVTVNEARGSAGLGPLTTADGAHDPDGDMPIAQFLAKHGASLPGSESEPGPGRTPPKPPGVPGPPGAARARKRKAKR